MYINYMYACNYKGYVNNNTHTCCSSMGSRAGSSSSATFSSRQGLPKRTQFSKLLKKSLSVNFNTSILWSFSYKQNACTIMFKMYVTHKIFDPFVSLALRINKERPSS